MDATNISTRVCRVCKATKPESECRTKQNICLICARDADKARYYSDLESQRKRKREYMARKFAEDPEKVRERGKAYFAANPEKRATKEYFAERWKRLDQSKKEVVFKRAETWRKIFPHKHASYQNARRAGKIRATPKWANDELIQSIYEEAARLTRLKKEKHHVDHIVPLKSKLVCGLHVEINLRVITAKENLEKSNKYWPDMP